MLESGKITRSGGTSKGSAQKDTLLREASKALIRQGKMWVIARWPLADEAVANKHFATLKDLDAALGERCRTLAAMPEAIKAATSFGWWPAARPANAVPNRS